MLLNHSSSFSKNSDIAIPKPIDKHIKNISGKITFFSIANTHITAFYVSCEYAA